MYVEPSGRESVITSAVALNVATFTDTGTSTIDASETGGPCGPRPLGANTAADCADAMPANPSAALVSRTMIAPTRSAAARRATTPDCGRTCPVELALRSTPPPPEVRDGVAMTREVLRNPQKSRLFDSTQVELVAQHRHRHDCVTEVAPRRAGSFERETAERALGRFSAMGRSRARPRGVRHQSPVTSARRASHARAPSDRASRED